MTSSVQLEIPPRRQWSHGHGYCGETVVQAFGLYNGAWISQQLVRDVNHGEYLIHHVTPEDDQQRRPRGGGGGGDPLATLKTLKFYYDAWDHENAPQPQFPSYCLWIKRCLLQGFPIMFRTKFDEFFAGHIMPIIGIDYSNENAYDERDSVHYYSLFTRGIIKQPLSELGRDPGAMTFCFNWGFVPLNVSIRLIIHEARLKGSSDAGFTIPYTVTNQKFILYNNNAHHRRSSDFSSKEQLNFFNEYESWYCDGAFTELHVKQEFFENDISRRTMKNLAALTFIATKKCY
ncbi:unnamed protein product [Rotaria socialis]|uniref:Uncharacterized protein n=1 Tax=Rotaria socialis TaxID=392032 RepID=A0A820KV95_9BILA|nr:unnamed protein product [Rotaria socialis]CAF4483272.1 unnamed protein product [Rotaria socialis]CAF4671329.1 unnamed protein product [Rotaria socialis]